MHVRDDYKLVMVPIKKLHKYEKNARTHSEEQVAQIMDSIKQFGWTNPLLIDEGDTIIAGHGRLAAAEKLKMKEVPCVRLEGLTEDQKRALVIADNSIALNGGWDNSLLSEELLALESAEFDLGLLGFQENFIEQLLHKTLEGETDEDEIPEVEDETVAIAALSDIWLLGKHRIVCGDCTDPLIVDMALGGIEPHLMVTDATGADMGLNRVWALFPGSVAYVWHTLDQISLVASGLEMLDFKLVSQLIWSDAKAKGRSRDYKSNHQPCWYAVKSKGDSHWGGQKGQSTIWQIDSVGGKMPVECVRRPILNNSSPGHAVFDPLANDGTVLMACETENRTCFGIEHRPEQIDVIIKRWQQFTGEEATLEADGRTWQAVKEQRAAELQKKVDGDKK